MLLEGFVDEVVLPSQGLPEPDIDLLGDNMMHEGDSSLLMDMDISDVPLLTWDWSQVNSQESAVSNSSFAKRASREHEKHQGNHQLAGELATLLADTALRTIIGGTQYRLTPGVTVCKPLLTYHLASIMPLLFSPGFASVCSSITFGGPANNVIESSTRVKNDYYHHSSNGLHLHDFSVANSKCETRTATEQERRCFASGCRESIFIQDAP